MNYANIDAASLNNPTVLNDFQTIKVVIQDEPESSTSKYHFIFLLQIDETEIDQSILTIQKELQEGWYTFFWSDRTLNIVFNTQKFQIALADGWVSKEYNAAKKYGRTQNIPEKYLDFKKFFLLHKNI